MPIGANVFNALRSYIPICCNKGQYRPNGKREIQRPVVERPKPRVAITEDPALHSFGPKECADDIPNNPARDMPTDLHPPIVHTARDGVK